MNYKEYTIHFTYFDHFGNYKSKIVGVKANSPAHAKVKMHKIFYNTSYYKDCRKFKILNIWIAYHTSFTYRD